MPLTTSTDLNGQPPEITAAATSTSASEHDTVATDPSSSPPLEAIDTGAALDARGAARRLRARDPPSPRRSTSSLSPPPHILATARCSYTADDRKESAQRRARADGRSGVSGPGNGASSRATAKHGGTSGRASLALSEQKRGLNSRSLGRDNSEAAGAAKRAFKREGSVQGEIAKNDEPNRDASAVGAALRSASAQGRASSNLARRRNSLGTAAVVPAEKKKTRVAGRATGTVPDKEREVLRGASSAVGRSSHPQKAPTASSPEAATGDLGNSGRASSIGPAASVESTRVTGPPSARTSAVVEAFLLRMQNCLSKQELLFQRLNASLAEVDARPQSSFLAAQPSPSLRQRKALSLSQTSGTGSDAEVDALAMLYSVATPTEAPLQPGNGSAERSVHTPHVSIDSANPSVAHDVELMSSFETQAPPLSTPHTPSCSVVVVHPTLERVTVAAPSCFLEALDQPSHPTSMLTSPTYLRLENMEVNTSTLATPSSVSEQLALLSSSVSETPSSPTLLRSTQRRRAPGSPDPAAPAATAPSPPPQPVLSARAPASPLERRRTPTDVAAAPHRYGPAAHFDSDREGGVYRQGARVAAAAPTRRSSAVQWEGGNDGGRTPPAYSMVRMAASVTSEGTSPPCSLSNPPPLPVLPGMRRSHSSSLTPGGEPNSTWMMSPPGAAAGGSLRLTTASNALSILTSIDSVTLSPLSRPMSAWGGSPVTRSVHGSGGSPLQQHHLARQPSQLSQGVMLAMSSSFSATGAGTPASARSPSGTLGRSSGGSPQRRHTAPERNALQLSHSGNNGSVGGGGGVSGAAAEAAGLTSPPVPSTSRYSPILYNFVSPPGAAAIPTSELPFIMGGGSGSGSGSGSGDLRALKLQPNTLSSVSSVTSNPNASAATATSTTAPNGLPVPPQPGRTLNDVLSTPSPSSPSPSSSPTTMPRRTSAVATRVSAKFASEGLSYYNSSFVSAYSLDEEAQPPTGELAPPPPPPARFAAKGSGEIPALPAFRGRSDAVGETGSYTPHAAGDSVPPAASGGGTGTYASTRGGAPAAVSTRRQLALSASPSIERTGREGGGGGGDADERTGTAPQHSAHDGVSAVSSSNSTASSGGSDDVEDEQPAEPQHRQSAAPFNPFAIPPPPSSLSELHAHQQRQRRRSDAPVPTMRRPPMAPARRSNSVDGAFDQPTRNAAVHTIAITATGAAQGGGADRAAHLEQWLSFERQHEQTHLPACWRDSEVVVVDHVEEEDRELDAEAQEQLRLLEADLMSGWQASLSSSERDDSQTRSESERLQQRQRQRSTGRRHSYPGSSSDRERPGFGRSEGGSNTSLDDEAEWDDEVDLDGSAKARDAQGPRPVVPHQRRHRHAPWHRSSNTSSSNNTTATGGTGNEAWVGAGDAAGRRRGRRLRTGDSESGTDAAAAASSGVDWVVAGVDDRGGAEERQRSNSPRGVPASADETSESQRAFRRGHSAPTVVSDGGVSDWQSLRARFDELVTIQQREAGRGPQAWRDGAVESSRSGNEPLRSRRHRSRGGSSRGSPAPFFASEEGAGSGADPTAAAPFARYMPAALATEARSGDDSPRAAVSTSSASAVEEKSRRRTMVYQDGAHRASHVAAAPAEPRSVLSSPTERTPSGPVGDGAAPPPQPATSVVAVNPTGPHESETDESAAEREESAPTPNPESPPDAADEGAERVAAANAAERPLNERRSSSAPAEQRANYEARAALEVASLSEGGPSADRHHRTGVTAIRKDPPAFLSASPPTFTVDASHTTGRATTATTTITDGLATAEDAAAAPQEARDAAEESVHAFSSDTSGSASTPISGTAEEVEEEPTAQAIAAPAAARPVRTPRLRFTPTPRGAGRLNTRTRGRRAVVLHSASAARAAAAKRSAEDGAEEAASAPTSAASTVSAPKQATTQERPVVRRKKAAPSAVVPGRAATRQQPKAPQSTPSPQPKASAAAGAAVAASGAAGPSLLSQHALDGGEVVEPVPPAPATTISSSTAAAAITTATSASPRVTSTPREGTRAARGAGTSAATASPGAVRVRQPGADGDGRVAPVMRRERPREREEEAPHHRPPGADGRRMSDAGAGAAEGAAAAATTTTESRALLRRLAQRKDRTRAMEERLRLNNGNFTSISGALALPAASQAASGEGEEGAGADSTASTPMRSALRHHAHAEPAPPAEAEEAPKTTATSSPLTVAVTNSPAGRSGLEPVSRSNSDSRHVSVVEPGATPSVTFAAGPAGGGSGQHPSSTGAAAASSTPHPSHAAAAASKANTRRRLLVDVRSRPTTSGGGKHGGAVTASRTSSSAVLSAAASSAAAPAAGSGAGGATVHTFKRGDSLRPHQRTASPPSAPLPPERRRHTIGDAPFSAMSEKRLRPTRTALHS